MLGNLIQCVRNSRRKHHVPRRRPKLLAIGLLAVLTMGTLAACGSSGSASSDTTTDTGWSYTSGNGDVITLDHKPERIIASAAEAGGLMAYGIKPVGIFVASDLDYELGEADFDMDGIEIVGEEWGHIDAERVAALEPDLIVADWWPPQEAYQGFEEGVDDDSMKVAELAPVIGASQQGSLLDVVKWYEGFAESMGIDVDSSELAADRERFESNLEEFQAAVEAQPGLTTLAVAPAEDMLYVAVPQYSTSLTDFKEWGLDVIDPDTPEPDFPYWEYLSWETADKYQPDLLLIDDRGYEDNIALGEAQPTWNKIAAAQAKAYASWPGFWVHSYGSYADQLDALTTSISQADATISG
jgi:iron complex transport system substrate-binding protein